MDPDRVRRARITAGLTLAEIAGDDVSRTFIHQVATGRDLTPVLSEAANRVRRFMAVTSLSPTQREAMKLVELALRQGAVVARTIGTDTHAPVRAPA